MKAKRTFDAPSILLEAKAGRLHGPALRKAIVLAEEFGKSDVADQLRLLVVHPMSFAGDEAPPEVRERVAKGLSALTHMGHSLARTRQMLKKHGVTETLNRIARYTDASKNFERLRDAGLLRLTAEAIILDFPHLFDEKAVEVARKRVGR